MKKTLLCGLLAWSMSAWAYTTTPSDDLRVWAEIPEIVADGETVNYIKVYEHDDQGLVYSAFNMELILPEGFRVNQVKDGRREVDDIKMTDRADATHSISCRLVDGVDLRIIAYSSVNADLYQDDLDGNPLDHLFTVGLIAEPTLTEGEHTLEILGVKFVMVSGDATVPATEPIYFPFTVTSSSGVDVIRAEGEDGAPYYDLNGRPVDPAQAHGTIVVSKGTKMLMK